MTLTVLQIIINRERCAAGQINNNEIGNIHAAEKRNVYAVSRSIFENWKNIKNKGFRA